MKAIAPKVIMLGLMCFFLFTSCEDNDNNSPENNYSSTENTRSATVDHVIEGTLQIIEQVYEENAGLSRSNSSTFFPDCATITWIVQGETGIITIDFGDSCTLQNDSVVSGKIIMDYGAFIAGTRTINYNFENYFYNGNGIEGGGEIFREIANENGNPQSTVNETIIVSFPNTDLTATRVGLRVSEWVEGVFSGTWTDNVYHVTGEWDTNLSTGFQRSGNVSEKLVRRLSCAYIESGIITFEQEGISGNLNYGNGTCDNEAILTIGDFEIVIQL